MIPWDSIFLLQAKMKHILVHEYDVRYSGNTNAASKAFNSSIEIFINDHIKIVSIELVIMVIIRKNSKKNQFYENLVKRYLKINKPCYKKQIFIL